MRAGSVCLLALVLAGQAVPGCSDVFLKYERSTAAYELMGQTVPAQIVVTTAWIGKEAARFEDGEKGAAIVDLKAGLIYLLDSEAKTFAKLSLNAQAAMMDAMKEEMAAEAEGGEDEEASEAMMQGMLGAMGAVQATVTPTAEKRTIDGLACVHYDLDLKLPMGATRSAIWASEELKVDPAVFQRVRNAFLAGFPGFDGLLTELAKIKGVPVLTESAAQVMGVSITTTETLLEHGERAAPAGTYAVPAGYTERPLFGGLEGGED